MPLVLVVILGFGQLRTELENGKNDGGGYLIIRIYPSVI